MSQSEFNYSGSKTVEIEEGSLYLSVYSLSKFIRLIVHLVMSKVPLTQAITTLHVLPGTPPWVLNATLRLSRSNFLFLILRWGLYLNVYLLHIPLLIDGAIWLGRK